MDRSKQIEFEDVWNWTWRQIFLCHHKLVRHNWWIDGPPCAFSFSSILLFRTRILTISVHQRPAVASGTKVVVCQKGLFGTPQSLTWELRLILIFLTIADLPCPWFIFQVPCLSSRRQWISFPRRLFFRLYIDLYVLSWFALYLWPPLGVAECNWMLVVGWK